MSSTGYLAEDKEKLWNAEGRTPAASVCGGTTSTAHCLCHNSQWEEKSDRNNTKCKETQLHILRRDNNITQLVELYIAGRDWISERQMFYEVGCSRL
jgi:hypothetical protein